MLFFLIVLKAQAQTNLYVSPLGKDNNKGSLLNPLKTLSSALRKVSSSKQSKVTIQLRGGEYDQDATLQITPFLLARHTLEISAYHNEHVIITGSKKINADWKIWKGNILETFIGKQLSIDQLFCNGTALPMARYPNFDSTKQIYHGTAEDAISPIRVKNWKHPEGGYVHALHNSMWGSFDYLITGKDSNNNLQLQGGWQNNRPSGMSAQYRFVENIFEELDAPGEWFYNKDEGILYLYPPKNVNIQTASFERSVLNDLIVLKGNEKVPVQNVTIKNISFTGTNRTFMLTKEPLLRSDWTIYRGGAILIDGGKKINISNCTFSELGGNAVFVSNYDRDITISRNEIHHIGASAILFVGSPNAVRSPSFRYEDFVPLDKMDKTPGPKTNEYPTDCTAFDNLIYNIGIVEKQATGVEIEMASSITVSHNSIYNTPRAGINIGDGCWGGHVIEFNDVFNTVLETGDHGAFNSWGRDRFWLPDINQVNLMVKKYPSLPLLDAIKPITLCNNRFYCSNGWDIDLDDGSTNFRIYNNVCLNGGLKLREGYNRVVENNVIVNNTFHPHVWYKNSRVVFAHNIVSNNYAPIEIDDWGERVDSNFFIQKTALEAAQKNGTDKHSLAGDPQFSNAATGNYNVLPTSGALKIGFKNFPVNNFGVIRASFKKKAKSPVIHNIKILQAEKKPDVVEWLGATIKNVETIGEQSAAGLPDMNGIMILTVKPGSLADKSGLVRRDIIRKIGDHAVTNVVQMLAELPSATTVSEIPAVIFHNQQEKQITLKLK